ncbi:hypothetical protein ACGFZL_07605 [Streptomyces sp. NPDC048182]|uniref:hypothetical protein n=1 Tax=Streptomyces sp. NPDC048182 TaxID=3365507 RepID=UPI0037226D34
MPDRSLRLFTLPRKPEQPEQRGAVLLRERPSTPPDSSSDRKDGAGQEDNPFAPPPEGSPDRPWQPRHPSGGDGSGDDRGREGGSPWGHQWSDRQPGRSSGGGFGERPGTEGQEPPEGRPDRRWDPTDPVQRRARYALLAGIWALGLMVFGWPSVALLLGALALYWGVSSLRAKPREGADAESARPQRTAAITGLVTSSLALLLVVLSFTTQLVYRDYYTCRGDALTDQAKQSCERLLPEQLRTLLGVEE